MAIKYYFSKIAEMFHKSRKVYGRNNEFKFLKFQIVQSAGVYMYIIKVGEFRQIKKMVLVK